MGKSRNLAELLDSSGQIDADDIASGAVVSSLGYTPSDNAKLITGDNILGSGDAGAYVPTGNLLGFDQSGVRSWNIKAQNGVLALNSGDGNGVFANGVAYAERSAYVNGTYHVHSSRHNFETFTRYYSNWSTSSNQIEICRVSTDWNDWVNSSIQIRTRRWEFNGGGEGKYNWRLGYGVNSLSTLYYNGNMSDHTQFSINGPNQVSGAPDDCEYFILYWNGGYYQSMDVEITVHGYDRVSSLTGYAQIKFP